MKELGLPRMEIYTWYGAFAPAGTPAAIVNRINADMNDLLRLPEIRASMAKLGMDPAGGPPSRLGDLVKAELPRWARVVKAAKIKAD
jgi:tripartite-type tricarboxylate transporter receptor subunit TctC